MARGRYPIRIKTSPPDPTTASKYLLVWESGDLYRNPETFPPLTSPSIFNNQGTLELEIGPGTGEFFCGQASRNPGVNFIGVDIALKPLYAAVARASRKDLANIKFIKADIRLLFPLFAPESIRMVYIHFPPPTTRPKHRKRGILTAGLLDRLALALVPGGLISFKTDEPAFYLRTLHLVQGDKRFGVASPDQPTERGRSPARSHHQWLWETRGRRTLEFLAKKI